MVKFMSKDKRKRRWFQFSLRMLFVVIAVLAVLFGWFGNRMRYVKKQRRAVEVIRNTGMRVLYDYQKGHRFRETKGFDTAEPRGPASYRKLLGDDFFSNVVWVWRDPFNGIGLSDGEMVHIRELSRLEALYLNRCEITDSGLEHVKKLNRLEELSLRGTQVTDTGLEYLNGLTNLQMLYLDGTQVTDAGLEHLEKLTKLERLNLSRTGVTDVGIRHLTGLTNLKTLDLEYTQVTDAGLEQLRGLTTLERLYLSYTHVPMRALTNCGRLCRIV